MIHTPTKSTRKIIYPQKYNQLANKHKPNNNSNTTNSILFHSVIAPQINTFLKNIRRLYSQ